MFIRFSPYYPNNPYQRLLGQALCRQNCTVLTGREDKAEVLHIHWQDDWLGQNIKHPCKVWTCHNLYPHGRYKYELLKQFARQMDEVIVHNRYSQKFLKQHLGISGTLIPHGHFIDVYGKGFDREMARRRLGFYPRHKVLLHLGSIKPYKNTFRLVEQFKELEDPDWRLLIAGKPHRINVQALREACSDDDRIVLHDRFIADDEMAGYLSLSDAMVLAYEHITTSGSAVLGMSYDLPIIAPNLAPLRELIKSGAFYKRHLAEALEAWPLLGAGNKDYIAQFDWKTVASKTVEVYHKAIQKI